MTASYSSGSDTPPATGTSQRGYFAESVPSLIAPDDQPVILLVSHVNRATLQAIRYAKAISTEVLALHIATNEQDDTALRERWEQCSPETPLIILPVSGRSMTVAIAEYAGAVLEQHNAVTVIIAETIHSTLARRLRQLRTIILIRYALRARTNIIVTVVRCR